MDILEVKNLDIGYNHKVVKKGISFTVGKGDYVCIVGQNGSGKSTLMKTLLGIIPKIGGEINFDKNIEKQDISYLTQSLILSYDFPATVEEVVLSGFIKSSILPIKYTDKEKAYALKMLSKMGVDTLLKRSFKELSGGQKQRVLLARALCNVKEILFLDEPVTGLDVSITEDLYNIVHKLNEEDGLTIIMISHDLSMVEKYATKVVKLDE